MFRVPGIPAVTEELIWELGGVFAILATLYLLVIFWLRNKETRERNQIGMLKRELAPMLSNFLFFEQESDSDLRDTYIRMRIEIRELLKIPLNRKVLTEVLLDLRTDVSGEARERIYKMYIDFGLDRDAYRKLKNWRWEAVSQGIRELTDMNVDASYDAIRKFINHPRSIIRKQAQLATVNLKNEGLGYFMDTARHRISEWQQLKLIEVLRGQNDFDPPRFRAWLVSENRDVVLFALRLILIYKQNDAEEAINLLLKHRSKAIRLAAIDCIREFRPASARVPLKELFPGACTEVKIQVLDALAIVGTAEDIPFLSGIVADNLNAMVRSKARGVINSIQPGHIAPDCKIEAGLEYTEGDIEIPQNTFEIPEGPIEPLLATGNISQFTDTPETPEPIHFQPWDREEEEEELFDICFRQEFDEILNEIQTDMKPKRLLPGFLPFVTGSRLKFDKSGLPEWLLNQDVRMEKPGLDEGFLPIVTDSDTEVLFEPDGEPMPAPTESGIPGENNLDEVDFANQFSIFREFFRHYDTESKLLLMAELPAVGGFKELQFLLTLYKDPDARIRKKAVQIAREISKKLNREGHPEYRVEKAEAENVAEPNEPELAMTDAITPDFEPHFEESVSAPDTGTSPLGDQMGNSVSRPGMNKADPQNG